MIEVGLRILQPHCVSSAVRNCSSSASVYRVSHANAHVHACDHAYHPRAIHNTQYVIPFPILHGFHLLTGPPTVLSAFTIGLPNITVSHPYHLSVSYAQVTAWDSRSHHLHYNCSVLYSILLWI